MSGATVGAGFTVYGSQSGSNPWDDPDLSIIRQSRRPPPLLPMAVFGPDWQPWIADAGNAGACPCDCVVGPLLSSGSALIGHARWAQATVGWSEPPHLWCGTVGDSGVGKSPGADCLRRDVLPEIEQRMMKDFPDLLREWKLAAETYAAKMEKWKSEVRTANKNNTPAPQIPADESGFEAPPATISHLAFRAATTLVADYLMPMAERVYGDAAATDDERRVATLARWIIKTRAKEVHVRKLQREVRLPGLRDAETIRRICEQMVDPAGWLKRPKIGFGSASKVVYEVNPIVLAQLP